MKCAWDVDYLPAGSASARERALELENRRLLEKVEELERRLDKRQALVYVQQRRHHSGTAAGSATIGGSKTYLKATLSSKAKVQNVPSSPSNVERRPSTRDEDGRLILDYCRPSYARATASSTQKKSEMTLRSEQEWHDYYWGSDDSETLVEDGKSSMEVEYEIEAGPTEGQQLWDMLNDQKRYRDEEKECPCHHCKDVHAAAYGRRCLQDEGETLFDRSRLDDDDFYKTPAGKVTIPYNIGWRTCNQAQHKAKIAVWQALRTHWPEAQREFFPEGPYMVRFGYGELATPLGDSRIPRKYAGMCNRPPDTIHSAMVGMSTLRNWVCHPPDHLASAIYAKDIDGLVKRAQNLAVLLLDESRAMQLRRLRDEIQYHARKSYEQVTNFELLGYLPTIGYGEGDTYGVVKRQWAVHHQRMFASIVQEVDQYNLRDYFAKSHWPLPLVHAALAWKKQSNGVGRDEPEYLAAVASKREEFFNISLEQKVALLDEKEACADEGLVGGSDWQCW